MILNLYMSIHLNILVSSNLLWSSHIQSICSKPRQNIGIIYCNFYQHASPQILLTLYHFLVIPYFTYYSSVWDLPVSSTNSDILEKPQHFSLKICSHKWDSDYSSLLSTFNLPTLSTHCSITELCLLYKITNNLLYFPTMSLIVVMTVVILFATVIIKRSKQIKHLFSKVTCVNISILLS